MENPSVYSRDKCFVDPLRPSQPCARNGVFTMCPKAQQLDEEDNLSIEGIISAQQRSAPAP